MKLKLLSALAIVIVAAGSVQAGDDIKSFKKDVVPVDTCRFRDMEFQIDGFYSAFFAGRNSAFRTGSGGGFGLNFFFMKYFGIGYEAQWYSNNGTAENLPLAGNFFIRYPICSWNLAPYIMVGGGGAWSNSHDGLGYGNVGGGLEYRFTDHIGLFVDSRYFYGGTGNVANLRSGLRIAF